VISIYLKMIKMDNHQLG